MYLSIIIIIILAQSELQSVALCLVWQAKQQKQRTDFKQQVNESVIKGLKVKQKY